MSLTVLRPFVVFSFFVSLALLGACGAKSQKDERLVMKSGDCLVNSDCVEPFVCAFERCHVECTTTKDCAGEEICIGAKAPSRVCRLEAESDCKSNLDCPKGLSCGPDGKCREGCITLNDCVSPQLCIDGLCAEKSELDETGSLPNVSAALACRLNSDCAPGMKCGLGLCVPECRSDVDCSGGTTCSDGACLYPSQGSCETSAECESPGAECVKGNCRCTCLKNLDCPGNETCDGCACSDSPSECSDVEPCETGERCIFGSCGCECKEDVDCEEGRVCDGCACKISGETRTISDAVINNSLDIARLAGVTVISGTLSLSASALVDCSGLSHIKSIGMLHVIGSGVTSLGCLSGLEKVVGDADIELNGNLEKLALPADLEIGGDVYLLGNPLLGSCSLEEFTSNLTATGFLGTVNLSLSGPLCTSTCNGDVCVP